MKNSAPIPVLMILGPTASGKSALALELARRLKGEILSADSMQVYRGMDIGTAKPGRAERQKIPHHLIDILEPSRRFSVVDYYRKALRAIRKVQRNGKLPILAGGTGFYIRALLEGLEASPPPDQKARKKLEAWAARAGMGALYTRLQKVAPQRAKQLERTDLKRIIRALEVAGWKKNKSGGAMKSANLPALRCLGYAPVVIGLEVDRPLLYARINARARAMLRRGWLGECLRLSKGRISATAAQAIGYRRLFELIAEHGTKAAVLKQRVPAVLPLIQQDTRRYAKRQMTWFRREKNALWFSWPEGETCKALSDRVLRHSGLSILFDRQGI